MAFMDLIPPPPATKDLERSVIETLASLDSGFYYWKPVVSIRHAAWLGISIDSVAVGERNWVFDIIDQIYGDPIPLAIGVQPDVISACVYDMERPSVRGRVLLDFRGGERDIFIPKSLLPPRPWDLDLSLTWSSECVAEMLKVWTETNTKRDDIYLLPYSKPTALATYNISNDVAISSDYFDYLLNADPEDASIIIRTLVGLTEFLSEQQGNE